MPRSFPPHPLALLLSDEEANRDLQWNAAARLTGIGSVLMLGLCALLLGLLVGCTTAQAAETSFPGKVYGVIDGDTIQVRLHGNMMTRVRLWGIDAPALDQPYGKQAADFVRTHIMDKDVTIVLRGRDRYHRMVADVQIDGHSLSEDIVCSGLAWWYRQYSPNSAALSECEAGARFGRLGLWRDKKPVPPWDWRKGQR